MGLHSLRNLHNRKLWRDEGAHYKPIHGVINQRSCCDKFWLGLNFTLGYIAEVRGRKSQHILPSIKITKKPAGFMGKRTNLFQSDKAKD